VSSAPGDSSEQRSAEQVILDLVGDVEGVTLERYPLLLEDGSRMELDGFSSDPLVLCEAWAHIGAPMSAQKHKVMTDALKLVVARSSLGPSTRCKAILAFCDEDAAGHFNGSTTWMAQALRQLDIDVSVVEVPPEVRESIIAAQKRQYR